MTRSLSPGASRSSTGEPGAGAVGSDPRHPAVNNTSANPAITRKQRQAIIYRSPHGPRKGNQEAKLWHPRRVDDNAWLRCGPTSCMSGSSGWQDLPEEVVAIL